MEGRTGSNQMTRASTGLLVTLFPEGRGTRVGCATKTRRRRTHSRTTPTARQFTTTNGTTKEMDRPTILCYGVWRRSYARARTSAGGRRVVGTAPWSSNLHGRSAAGHGGCRLRWWGAGAAQHGVADSGRGTYPREGRTIGIDRRRLWD